MQESDSPTAPQSHASGAVVPGAAARLRVLVVGVSWPMETFVERLLMGLARAGVELTLASMSSLAQPPREWTSRHRIRWADDAVPRTARLVARVASGRAGGSVADALRPARLLRGNRRGREELLAGPWDVLYAPWLSVLVDHPGLLRLPAPVVTSCRGALVTIAPWDPSRSGYREALADVFDASALVHCVSDAIVSDAVELGMEPAKARVVRPAVDPLDFMPGSGRISSEALRVVGVGTLTWRKDYEHALVAMRRSVDAGADLRLDLIGDGPDRSHLRFAIDDLGLGERVRLLGRRPPAEVAADLRRADVFLHTSCSEGISNAVLEAMASGLPVVTTDAGGMREAVRDGVDGFVVPVRDAAATATALVRLAGDPELRARMGASARQQVEARFCLDQQVDAFAALLREAAGT